MNTGQSLQELANRRFVTLWIVSLLTGMLNAPVHNLLPVYMEAESGASPLLSAGLRSTFLLLGGFFAIPAGYLCDRIGVKITFLLGASGTMAAGAIFLTNEVPSLYLLCIYIGVSSGFSITASQAYLIQSAPRASMGLGAAAFFLGMTLGSAIGNRLTGQVAEAFGFDTIGRIIVAGALAVMILMALTMPAIDRAPAASGAQARTRELIRRPEVRLLLGIRFLPTCYWGSATLLIPLLIYRASGSLALAADYAAISLVIASVCQITVGRIADKYGARIPTLTASVCVAISAVCTGVWADSVEGLYLFGVTGTASAWSVSTMMPRLIDTLSSVSEKGRLVGLAHLAWSLGMLLGSLWGGYAVAWGPGIPFLTLSIGCMATVVLLALLFKKIGQQG